MTIARLFSRLSAPVERLLAALCDPVRRERTVVAVLLGYVAIWTLYGVLAKASQDVHIDMAEIFGWSRELALGYPKHPPLTAWIMAGWFAVFPVADWAFYLLAMTVAGVALWIAWRLAQDYLDAEKSVVALALLMLVPFFNFHALKYNANTVLLPLWAATALCFLRSFERRSVLWAALAGLCAAGAMLGKYWSIVLLVGLGLAALLDSRRAAYFKSAAPWVTIAAGAAAFAPHFIWLAAQSFGPALYVTSIHSNTEWSSVKSAVNYLAGSAAYVALPVLMAVAATRPGRAVAADMLWPTTPARRLAAAAFWGPLLLPVAAAPLLGVEITSLWSMSAWALLPVLLLSSPQVSLPRGAVLAIVIAAMALPPLMVAAAPAIAIAIHRKDAPPVAIHSRLLAERVAHEWRLRTDRPLRVVGGDVDLAYGVAVYLPSRPLPYPEFNRKLAPWVDPARLHRDGIAIVCRADDPTCPVAASAQGLTGPRVEVDITRSHFGTPGKTGRYLIVIVPPRP
jgi:4-amino-4-deoxy-L-arabinose transferase-like glycosyltransferase